jgi:DNA-binding Lrp family transcriptional regulator
MKELKKRGGWFMVDNVLIDDVGKHIGCVPLCIYLSLKRHANQSGVAWPKYKLIAKELGISERTVSRNIESLVEYGLISRMKKRHGGQWANYKYYIEDRELWRVGSKPTDKKSLGYEDVIDHTTKTTRLHDFDDINHETESPTKNTNFINTKKEDTRFFLGKELTDEERKQKFVEAKKAFYSSFDNRKRL